jgi:hypothetical protein
MPQISIDMECMKNALVQTKAKSVGKLEKNRVNR